MSRILLAGAASLAFLPLMGCLGQSTASAPTNSSCASTQLQSNTGTTGTASVFMLDPMTFSMNPNLTPNSLSLDQYRSTVLLSHLGGNGVLEGQYVDIRNGLDCNGWFGASDEKNNFTYTHSDFRFQEAMSYYYGDLYRARLDSLGYLMPTHAVEIDAHCMLDDNAYFSRQSDANGNITEYVCLGDSVATPGAYYADDATVVVHELEHATTMDSYSSTIDLQNFKYDEGGALNEALSDFMSLVDTEALVTSPFDPRTFSRWALGTFVPGQPNTRGAQRCPTYDSTYPNCTGFPGFSAENNTISYVYPDGADWPYANTFSSPGYVANAFKNYQYQEEIHNGGVLMVGALWDVYEAIQSEHDATTSQTLTDQLVLETVRNLPKPTALHFAPVGFRVFAQQLLTSAASLSFSSADQSAISQALTTRGLIGGTGVPSGWAAVGAGVSPNAGMRIEDDPTLLKSWLAQLGVDGSVIPQGFQTGLNRRLDPGEVDAIWFDIENTSSVTAGDVEVTVTQTDPDVQFVDSSLNFGPISSSQAQMIYGKINGTSIVTALSSTNTTFNVPTGNSYFLTDPFFGSDLKSAIWVRVSSTAAHGKQITFQVQATPSNGATSTASFTTTIN